MNTDVINAFLKATKHVLETMAQVDPKAQSPRLKSTNQTYGVVSGIIGLAGSEMNGNMMVSFDEQAILRIVSNMLGEEFQTVNDEVADAVGELTNMITGVAKVELANRGYQFEMAIPVTIVGKGTEISQMSKTQIIEIPFQLSQGSFTVDCHLEPRGKKGT